MGFGRISGVWECFRILAYLRGVGIRNYVWQSTETPVLVVSILQM